MFSFAHILVQCTCTISNPAALNQRSTNFNYFQVIFDLNILIIKIFRLRLGKIIITKTSPDLKLN